MNVKLLTEHDLALLSLNGGCRGWSESTLFKMSHCWKSHVLAHKSQSSDQSSAGDFSRFAHCTITIKTQQNKINKDNNTHQQQHMYCTLLSLLSVPFGAFK